MAYMSYILLNIARRCHANRTTVLLPPPHRGFIGPFLVMNYHSQCVCLPYARHSVTI
jgi:hypothetical protein